MIPDYPGAIVLEAHPTNWRTYQNVPKGWVLHTPEEPADNNETTPAFFAAPNRQASTHYYLDNDGDVYQMVAERYSPIANGVLGKPYPSWANRNTSLNSQSLNVEIEGRAATIHETMAVPGPQFDSLVRLIRHRANFYGFPPDREHIIGHYQVSIDRSDPGAKFPWAALIAALNPKGDDDMPYLAWDKDRQRVYLIGPTGAKWIVDAGKVAALEADLGKMAVAYSATTIEALT
jgi:N-acetyl-anhydromuramyl-L-alanine amidase AmpD